MKSYRQPNKLILAAAALAIATPVMVITVDEVQASTVVKEFSDVSKQNAYYNTIKMMTASNIINGYDDGTFKPNQSISRKHAAALIGRAIDLSEVVKLNKSVAVPKDLSTKNAYYKDILTLVQAGLLSVDSKGNVNPNKELSRGEMAKILAVAFELKGTKHSLKDVSKSVEPYVAALYENDVTTGYEDGTFKEKQTLSRAHYAVFMYRAMENSKAFEQNLKVDGNSTAEEINCFLVSNDNVSDKVEPISEEWAKNQSRFVDYVVSDIDSILEGTNLKVTSIWGDSLYFKEDGWKNKDTQSYLSSQVTFSYTPDDDFLKLSFDYTLDNSVLVAKRLLEIANTKQFNLNENEVFQIFDEKLVEANNNFTDKTFENGQAFFMNEYRVQIGVYLVDKSKTFNITIMRASDL